MKLSHCLVLFGCLVLAGCGDDSSRTMDPGIMLMDAQVVDSSLDSTTAMPDSGASPDTEPSPMPTPTPTPGSCMVSGFSPLPEACLPRCSNATLTALMGCGMDGECQQMAIANDTTPPVDLDAGGMITSLNCEGCVNFQANTCVAEACPTEFEAFGVCTQGGGDCSAEETAVLNCAMADPSFQMCFQNRALGCFG